MDTVNCNLALDGVWQFHLGEFERARALPGWKFHATSKAGGALSDLVNFKEAAEWQEVCLPHDWLTEQPVDPQEDGTGGCKRRGTAWYIKTFMLPSGELKNATLFFDGVMGQSVVYVNGVVACRNFSGYNRFSCEIGDYLSEGENEIAVYVDARRWEGWWYEGAGIYRPVYIRFRNDLRFNESDCFTRTELKDGVWHLIADLVLSGDTVGSSVVLKLKDGKDKIVAEKTVKASNNIRAELQVKDPDLWSPETPVLYYLKTELKQNGKTVDTINRNIGFREIVWVANKGMFLNGKRYTVKGLCCHQDHAGLGIAVTPEVEEFRILKLKEMGANAYRCAHHAPSESLLSVCDRVGMLVMSENRHFDVSEDVLKQIDALVRLSRNHPCVFLYGMFNEEPWQEDVRGKRIAEKMRARVKSLDDTRAVTAAQNGGMLKNENASDSLDVIGINYNLAFYEQCHTRSANKVILGTENSVMFATRGVAETDREKQVFADNGYEKPGDFSEPIYETMECVEKYPFVAGCFNWSGFDHRGEPNPYEYPSVYSHWGLTDTCGFDKNVSYLLRAWYLETPYIKLSQGWNFAEGKTVTVSAFTNALDAELFLNGKSLGKKKVMRRRAEWEVPSSAGVLRVTATAESGAVISDEIRTAGSPFRLVCEDVTPLSSKPCSRIVNISVADKTGTLVPDCNETVRFTLKKGKILGVGNGNPNGHQTDRADSVPLFNSRAQVIVDGEAQGLTVYCADLQSVTLWEK